MSTIAKLIVLTALHSGSSATITSETHTFTQGMNPMVKCRALEGAYHSGASKRLTEGNKTISIRISEATNRTYEITTFCSEEP